MNYPTPTTGIVVLAIGVLFLAALLIAGALELVDRWRRRRAQHAAQAAVRVRLDDLRAMPAPDEIPRADDLTKGQRRQLRQRRHPIMHKRGSRRLGE